MIFQKASTIAEIGFLLISTSLIFLISSIIAAKNKKLKLHYSLMVVALLSSITFLITYIIRWVTEGDTKFDGPDSIRYFIYYPILVVHISLALLSVFFVGKQLLITIRSLSFSSNNVPVLKGEARTNHLKNGIIAYKIWGLSFSGGIITFILLYILF